MKPTPTETLAGGERVPCTLADGTSVNIFIRQVKPSELLAYLEAEAGGEEAVLRLVASRDGQPLDLDTLSLDSYEALIEADQRQNFTAARKREKREGERAARMLDSLKVANPEMHAKIMQTMGAETQSLISSLTPSPAAAAPGKTAPQESPSPS